jgi:hypothetical protein
MLLQIDLLDSDFDRDDPIGLVTIPHEALAAALASGEEHPVLVLDQETQIMFVTIQVRAFEPQE